MDANKIETVAFRIDPATKAILQEIARANDMTLGAVIRTAVKGAIKNKWISLKPNR
jgi:predicted transcriptional regulator